MPRLRTDPGPMPATPEHKARDRRVSIALVFFWGPIAVTAAVGIVWPDQLDSFNRLGAPIEPLAELAYVISFIYPVYACIVHAGSDRYKGINSWSCVVLLLVGHIFTATIYHPGITLRT